jgi:hypothetical protein
MHDTVITILHEPEKVYVNILDLFITSLMLV